MQHCKPTMWLKLPAATQAVTGRNAQRAEFAKLPSPSMSDRQTWHDLPLADVSGAAPRLHQNGHSCNVQHVGSLTRQIQIAAPRVLQAKVNRF